MASGAVKRKHEELESDSSSQTALDQRQSILNMSMVKLRSPGATYRRVDTSLRRSVLIFNTLRHIEYQLQQEGVTVAPGNKPLLPSLQPLSDVELDPRPSTPAPGADSDRTLHRLEAMEISAPGPALPAALPPLPTSPMDTTDSSTGVTNSSMHLHTMGAGGSASPLALQTLPPMSSLTAAPLSGPLAKVSLPGQPGHLPSLPGLPGHSVSLPAFPGQSSAALPGPSAALPGPSAALPGTTVSPPVSPPVSPGEALLSERSLWDARFLQDSLLGCERLTVASFMSMFELEGSPLTPPAPSTLPPWGAEFSEALADLDLTPLDLDLFLPLTSKLPPLSAEELMHTLPPSDPFPQPPQNPSPCNHKNELLGEELDHVMQVLRVGGI